MSLLLLFPSTVTSPTTTNDTYITCSSSGPDLLDIYVDGVQIMRLSQ